MHHFNAPNDSTQVQVEPTARGTNRPGLATPRTEPATPRAGPPEVGIGITITTDDGVTYTATSVAADGTPTTIAVGTEAEAERAARSHIDSTGQPKRYAKRKQQRRRQAA